jgi:type I restriction enzyme S subunit
MKNNWNKKKLEDFITIIDGDRGKNYPKNDELLDKGFCLFLSTKNVPDRKFDFSQNIFITSEKDSLLRSGKLIRGDIVFTTRGTIGNIAIFNEKVPFENIRINSGMVILRNEKGIIDTKFLHQCLLNYDMRAKIKAASSGSAQPQLPIKDMNTIEFVLPPLPEQQKIAEVLGSLDDKIELNNRMNKTLEEMAKGIFKSWFVDFDIVKAKEAKKSKQQIMKDFNISGEVYDLFPSGFEESALGRIPKGWEVGLLQDVSAITTGKNPPIKYNDYSQEFNIPVYGGNGISWYTNEILVDKFCILTGRVGTLGTIHRVEEPAWVSDNAIIITPTVKFDDYVFFVLHNIDLLSLDRGSTQPLITQTDLKNQNILIPNREIIKMFSENTSTLFNKIYKNKKQNKKLSQMRDYLLPRLISGKTRVN